MKTKLYQSGNPWQRKAYSHLSEHLEKKGIREFGVSARGTSYQHLLQEEDARYNFVNERLYKQTLERFSQHKAGDLNRILTNTASSQAYCFNLFLYLNEHKTLSSELFSELFGKTVEVKHIELEFTPNQMLVQPFASDSFTPSEAITEKNDESIGDQSEFAGTDADVAVFYTYNRSESVTESDTLTNGSKKGVLLIEFKFIEAEFSVCSSYKNKTEARPYCNSTDFYQTMIINKQADDKQKPLCGYTRYQNWQLTAESEMFSDSLTQSETITSKNIRTCPFRFGLNQLWRNMLLVEKIAEVRQCNEFGFWVLSPQPNDSFLWNEKGADVEQLFRAILTEKGNSSFRKVHLEEIFAHLERLIDLESDKAWLEALKEKYLIYV